MKVRRIPSVRPKKRFIRREPRAPKTGGSLWAKLAKMALFIGFPLGVATAVGLLWYGYSVLPPVENAQELSFAESTTIYDRGALEEGANPAENILYVIHGDENRDYVPLSEISPWLEKATIAFEDDGFYRHPGFDVGGLIKAFLAQAGIGPSRGGSTITQQLVKNTFLDSSRTFARKFNEILLSIKMEKAYTKEEILELYLNRIPYGPTTYGAEAAAREFFAKGAADLTLAEAAILAGLPNSPVRLSPYGDNKDDLMGYTADDGTWVKGRKDRVLDRMLAVGYITQAQYNEAFNAANVIEFKRNIGSIKAPHFVFYVKSLIEEAYGADMLREGGLSVYTTLDPTLQDMAEETIKELTPEYYTGFRASNTALGAINPDNGEILAYYGGNYFAEEFDGQVDVLQAYRQPGSSMKPFVFGAAFNEGFTPGTVLWDVKTDFGTADKPYVPQNYSETFNGPVLSRKALNESLNIPAVKMAALAGSTNVIAFSQAAGVEFQDPEVDHGVAIGVGSAEVKPMTIISAYQTFTGDGSYHTPSAILKVTDADGNIIETLDHEARKQIGIPTASAALVRDILTDQTTRPSSWNKRLQLDGIDNGAKTGTSNKGDQPSDSWTIGFSPYLVSGVWVGNNNGEAMVGGATGMRMAAPIWNEFNEKAHKYISEQINEAEYGTKPYSGTFELERRTINRYSGGYPTDATPVEVRVTEVFDPANLPKKADASITTIAVDRITGIPATDETPEYLLEDRVALKLTSEKPSDSRWEGPVQNWLAANPKFVLTLGAARGKLDEPDWAAVQEQYEAAKREYLIEEGLVYPDAYQDTTGDDMPEDGPTYETPAESPTVPGGLNGPSVRIIEPTDGTLIDRDVIVVRLAPRARAGIADVVVFLNDTPIKRIASEPWQTNIDVSTARAAGGNFVIRAVITDDDGRTSDAKVLLTSRNEGAQLRFRR